MNENQTTNTSVPKTAEPSTKNFPVICIGGSAGGLDAYIRLLQNLRADMGVAFVIVNHMTTLPTQLHTVLPRFTTMPVELITEKLIIEPNRVFIIPSNRDLHVSKGEFRLKPISKPRGWPDVITVFLRSLTYCWDGKLVAIIVSGYDGDGADALCGIKEVGGITIAQNLVPRNSQTCRRAQLRVDASILCYRQKISLKSFCDFVRVQATKNPPEFKTESSKLYRALR